MIGRAFETVERAVFGPVPSAPLALSRALLGLTMASAWAMALPWLDLFYGPEGMSQWLRHGGHPHWIGGAWPIMVGCIVVGSISFAAGFRTRLSAILLLVPHLLLIDDFRDWTWGWPLTGPLFYGTLALGGAGRAWSVDAWLASGRARGGWRGVEEVSGWGARLVLLTLSCVYLAAGWHRIDDPSWINGDIIWEALTGSTFSRWSWIDWNPFKPALRALSYVSWALEDLGVVLLLIPRVRPWWAVGLIGMHVGLELSATVGWWQPTLASALVVALWPGLCSRLLERLWKIPGQALLDRWSVSPGSS